MMVLISGFVGVVEPVETSRSPVRAVTVTTEVISEPELVMNCLLPLRIHSPSRSSARGRVAPPSAPPAVRREADRRRRVARDQVGQPLVLLLVGAEGEDRVDPETDRRLEGDPHRLVHPADLLDGPAQAGEVAVRTAVLLGSGEAAQAQRDPRPPD